MPTGETDQTCLEHINTMKREMQKMSNKNLVLVKSLMDLTFSYRRRKVVSELLPVKDTLSTYPAQQLVSEFKEEFGRVIGDGDAVASMAALFKEKWQIKILELAKKKTFPSVKSILTQAQEAIMEKPETKPETEEAASVAILPLLIKDRNTSSSCAEIIKICSNDEAIDEEIGKSIFPRIVASGELSSLNPVYLVAEGMIVCRLCNMGMATSLSLLVACYYVLNMEYPSSCKSFFMFLETVMLNNCGDSGKRVSINKFLKELNM